MCAFHEDSNDLSRFLIAPPHGKTWCKNRVQLCVAFQEETIFLKRVPWKSICNHVRHAPPLSNQSLMRIFSSTNQRGKHSNERMWKGRRHSPLWWFEFRCVCVCVCAFDANTCDWEGLEQMIFTWWHTEAEMWLNKTKKTPNITADTLHPCDVRGRPAALHPPPHARSCYLSARGLSKSFSSQATLCLCFPSEGH